MLSVLNDTSASEVLGTLGFSTVGKNFVASTTQANARASIGVVSSSEAGEGLITRATTADVAAGTNDTKAITPAKLKLGFSASLGVNGFIQFPTWLSGVRFEWGRFLLSSTAATLVTLNFPTNCFVFLPILGEVPDQADVEVGGYVVSNTTAKVGYFHGGPARTAPIVWFAIGN